MPGSIIVRHCSPTLAGMKTGNLFTYRYTNEVELNKELNEWNSLLNAKGIYFVSLKRSGRKALIYVYRKKHLEKELSKKEIVGFLKENGYLTNNIEKCLECLSEKLVTNSEFPHEIGVFLGYPLSDIKAFIENKGKGYMFIGYWKVYSNECEAQKIFNKYKKCTNIYCKKQAEGFAVTQLTVAV